MKTSILFPSGPPTCETQYRRALDDIVALAPHLRCVSTRQVSVRNPDDSGDYLAGTDAERAEEILTFLQDPELRTAWFGRGGYGATRLLTKLGIETKKLTGAAPRKRWIGYSDITALFALVKAKHLNVECIHGPMICAFSKQPNKSDVLRAVEGIAVPIPVENRATGLSFDGPIWGGNLAVLASLCGTAFLPTPQSGAVFLEDVEEAPYRVDRYITQLFDSGFFTSCKKIFLGTFTGFKPEAMVLQVARRRCQELGLEVLGELPIGHSEPHYPLFLDRPYRFDPQNGCLMPAPTAEGI